MPPALQGRFLTTEPPGKCPHSSWKGPPRPLYTCSYLATEIHCWKHHSKIFVKKSVQFSSIPQSCLTLCYPMDSSLPGFPVHHQLLELPQTHVHWVSDAIQSSHPLPSPSLPAFNLSQNQDLFKWVRLPKYWSFSFSISPSNEYSGLISFRIDWFDPLAVQRTLKSQKVKWLFRKKNNERHYILTKMYFYFFKTCFFLHFSFCLEKKSYCIKSV